MCNRLIPVYKKNISITNWYGNLPRLWFIGKTKQHYFFMFFCSKYFNTILHFSSTFYKNQQNALTL